MTEKSKKRKYTRFFSSLWVRPRGRHTVTLRLPAGRHGDPGDSCGTPMDRFADGAACTPRLVSPHSARKKSASKANATSSAARSTQIPPLRTRPPFEHRNQWPPLCNSGGPTVLDCQLSPRARSRTAPAANDPARACGHQAGLGSSEIGQSLVRRQVLIKDDLRFTTMAGSLLRLGTTRQRPSSDPREGIRRAVGCPPT